MDSNAIRSAITDSNAIRFAITVSAVGRTRQKERMATLGMDKQEKP